MFSFSSITDWIDQKIGTGLQKRMFMFLIKKYTGNFLFISDSQIDLMNGKIDLIKPSLNVLAINQMLKSLPIKLESGVIDSVNAKVFLHFKKGALV